MESGLRASLLLLHGNSEEQREDGNRKKIHEGKEDERKTQSKINCLKDKHKEVL